MKRILGTICVLFVINCCSGKDVESMSSSERRLIREADARCLEFIKLIVNEKLDDAYKFISPSLKRTTDKSILMGHLQMLSGSYKIHNAKKFKIDIYKVILSERKKYAKVTPKFRAGSGKWHISDEPIYFSRSGGRWYIGNDKELKKEF